MARSGQIGASRRWASPGIGAPFRASCRPILGLLRGLPRTHPDRGSACPPTLPPLKPNLPLPTPRTRPWVSQPKKRSRRCPPAPLPGSAFLPCLPATPTSPAARVSVRRPTPSPKPNAAKSRKSAKRLQADCPKGTCQPRFTRSSTSRKAGIRMGLVSTSSMPASAQASAASASILAVSATTGKNAP